MATRTFKMKGFLTEGTADITVTFNSIQVFSGTVDNVDRINGFLYSFTADISLRGDIATTVVNNSGSTVFVGPLDANYVVPEGGTYLDNNNIKSYSSNDARSIFGSMNNAQGDSMKEIKINEEDREGGTANTGWIPVPLEAGQTLTCNMVVDKSPRRLGLSMFKQFVKW